MIASQSMDEEAALVKRARAGDGDAFGELYLCHLDSIYRYIYFRIGDQHEAEDLTEQVFLKAWEALPGYKDFGHPFTSWLYRIAHNLIIDYLRHKKPISEDIGNPEREEDQLDNTVVRQILETEETSLLAAAIIRLPEEQQQVIILRFVEGLNHSEVSRILNKSEGACRMIQNRALIALNQLLSGPEG